MTCNVLLPGQWQSCVILLLGLVNCFTDYLLWCTTTRRHHLLPRSALRIGTDAITPSTTVRDLGIFIDADLSRLTYK